VKISWEYNPLATSWEILLKFLFLVYNEVTTWLVLVSKAITEVHNLHSHKNILFLIVVSTNLYYLVSSPHNRQNQNFHLLQFLAICRQYVWSKYFCSLVCDDKSIQKIKDISQINLWEITKKIKQSFTVTSQISDIFEHPAHNTYSHFVISHRSKRVTVLYHFTLVWLICQSWDRKILHTTVSRSFCTGSKRFTDDEN